MLIWLLSSKNDCSFKLEHVQRKLEKGMVGVLVCQMKCLLFSKQEDVVGLPESALYACLPALQRLQEGRCYRGGNCRRASATSVVRETSNMMLHQLFKSHATNSRLCFTCKHNALSALDYLIKSNLKYCRVVSAVVFTKFIDVHTGQKTSTVKPLSITFPCFLNFLLFALWFARISLDFVTLPRLNKLLNQ